MRKMIRKWFWVWDFDKEEKWLNEMATKGLALTAVGWCRYEFENCVPGEYKVCVNFLDNHFNSVENEKYISFLEETGAEHVGSMFRWAYFRKKTADEDFQLFSDNASRIRYLTQIIRFIALIGGWNLCMGAYNLFLFIIQVRRYHNYFNLLGIVNLLLAVLCAYGMYHVAKKRKKLKTEQQIFE